MNNVYFGGKVYGNSLNIEAEENQFIVGNGEKEVKGAILRENKEAIIKEKPEKVTISLYAYGTITSVKVIDKTTNEETEYITEEVKELLNIDTLENNKPLIQLADTIFKPLTKYVFLKSHPRKFNVNNVLCEKESDYYIPILQVENPLRFSTDTKFYPIGPVDGSYKILIGSVNIELDETHNYEIVIQCTNPEYTDCSYYNTKKIEGTTVTYSITEDKEAIQDYEEILSFQDNEINTFTIKNGNNENSGAIKLKNSAKAIFQNNANINFGDNCKVFIDGNSEIILHGCTRFNLSDNACFFMHKNAQLYLESASSIFLHDEGMLSLNGLSQIICSDYSKIFTSGNSSIVMNAKIEDPQVAPQLVLNEGSTFVMNAGSNDGGDPYFQLSSEAFEFSGVAAQTPISTYALPKVSLSMDTSKINFNPQHDNSKPISPYIKIANDTAILIEGYGRNYIKIGAAANETVQTYLFDSTYINGRSDTNGDLILNFASTSSLSTLTVPPKQQKPYCFRTINNSIRYLAGFQDNPQASEATFSIENNDQTKAFVISNISIDDKSDLWTIENLQKILNNNSKNNPIFIDTDFTIKNNGIYNNQNKKLCDITLNETEKTITFSALTSTQYRDPRIIYFKVQYNNTKIKIDTTAVNQTTQLKLNLYNSIGSSNVLIKETTNSTLEVNLANDKIEQQSFTNKYLPNIFPTAKFIGLDSTIVQQGQDASYSDSQGIGFCIGTNSRLGNIESSYNPGFLEFTNYGARLFTNGQAIVLRASGCQFGIKDGAKFNLQGSANIDIRDSAKLNMSQAANIDIRDGAKFSMNSGANITMTGTSTTISSGSHSLTLADNANININMSSAKISGGGYNLTLADDANINISRTSTTIGSGEHSLIISGIGKIEVADKGSINVTQESSIKTNAKATIDLTGNFKLHSETSEDNMTTVTFSGGEEEPTVSFTLTELQQLKDFLSTLE